MTRGWFVGDFDPSILKTELFEVAVMRYRAGDTEPVHAQHLAQEVTVVIEGRVTMMGMEWGPGDIILIEPNEASGFEALTDAVTVAVKTPSLPNDKYLVTE